MAFRVPSQKLDPQQIPVDASSTYLGPGPSAAMAPQQSRLRKFSPTPGSPIDSQRNSIAAALMNIAKPPPQTQLPQMPPPRPLMGMPQMQMPGGPPQGTPPPTAPQTSMPMSLGAAPPPSQPMQMAGVSPMGSMMAPNPMQMATGATPQAQPDTPPGLSG